MVILDGLRKGDMSSITKRQVLSDRRICSDCRTFVKSHKVIREPEVYIGNTLVCKGCKIQFDMMDNKITAIWKML